MVAGLGQLYAGAVWRALVVCLAVYVANALLIILFLGISGPVVEACVIAGFVLVVVTNVVDAARTARAVAASGAARPWISRWPAVTTVGLLFAFGVQPAYLTWIKHSFGEAYRLPSNSMAPGLLAGDWITAIPLGPDAVKRGARPVFHAWEGQILIKRVVGLPGDTIGMRNDTLEINGRLVREPYVYIEPDTSLGNEPDTLFNWQRAHLATALGAHDYHPTVRTWGPLVVPPDSIFVLGDNRENSDDSRYRGFIARSAFFRRPTGIYFSRDPGTGKTRWSRIGMRIE